MVDDEGDEIFADKVGVIMARDLAPLHPGATFVADVKSTGLFASDPELQKHGIKADYWKTGHSHMKRRVAEVGALAGFEKSGHYFLAEPIGRGYDAGGTLAGRPIKEVITVNGARLMLDNGAWGLVRASSNTPNLVVVCESPESEAEMRAIFADLDAVIRTEPSVGDYDQKI